MLKKYFLPKLDNAVTNSKVVYQKRVVEHKIKFDGNKGYRIWEWNPCTNVYMLIEAIQLKKQKFIKLPLSAIFICKLIDLIADIGYNLDRAKNEVIC